MNINGQEVETITEPFRGGWRSVAFLPHAQQVASQLCGSREAAEMELYQKLKERLAPPAQFDPQRRYEAVREALNARDFITGQQTVEDVARKWGMDLRNYWETPNPKTEHWLYRGHVTLPKPVADLALWVDCLYTVMDFTDTASAGRTHGNVYHNIRLSTNQSPKKREAIASTDVEVAADFDFLMEDLMAKLRRMRAFAPGRKELPTQAQVQRTIHVWSRQGGIQRHARYWAEAVNPRDWILKTPRVVMMAAIRILDGRVFTGETHAHCFGKMQQAGLYPGCEEDDDYAAVNRKLGAKAGWLTSTGEFVDRREGYRIARRARQTDAHPSGKLWHDTF